MDQAQLDHCRRERSPKVQRGIIEPSVTISGTPSRTTRPRFGGTFFACTTGLIALRARPNLEAMDELVFTINYILRRLKPRMPWKDEEESKRAAEQVADHLRQCNYEIKRRPERGGHSTP